MKTGIVAFFAGVLCLYQLTDLPSLIGAHILIPCFVLWLYKPKSLFVFAFFCGFFWALFRADMMLERQLDASLEGEDLIVSGYVEGLAKTTTQRQQILFKVMQAEEDLAQRRLKLNWYKDFRPMRAGEYWRLSVRLKRPNGFSNPGVRDYEASLFQQGIHATGTIRKAEGLEAQQRDLFQGIHGWRQSLYINLKQAIPELNGIIPALALGIKDDLSRSQWQVLSQTGTHHLVAISGLHIGLIAGLAWLIGRWLWVLFGFRLLNRIPAQKAAAVFSIVMAFVYAALAGFSIPTQRALVMVVAVMFCLLSDRRLSHLQIFLIALFCVIVLSPSSVISIGFVLSFAAVGLILYCNSARLTINSKPSKAARLTSLFKMQLIFSLGLAPLLLLYFAQNPLFGAVANFIAVPFIGLLITPLILTGMLLLTLVPALGIFLLTLADQLVDGFWPFLQGLADLPYASIHAAPSSTSWVLLSLLGIAILVMPRGLPGRWLGVLFVFPVFFIRPQPPALFEFEFTLLDVGQGLSAVIRSHDHVLVFDTGARFSADFDAAKAVLIPYLRSQGIERVDSLIISHGDNDHIGGYQSLREEFEIVQTITSVDSISHQPQVQLCQAGDSWSWDGIKFEILHPLPAYQQSKNNRSCVLRVSNATHSVLLTGDIEAEAEFSLLAERPDRLASDILIGPHHGSKTSSTRAFIEAVGPEYVLFPVGYRNRHHHPAEEVVERYRQAGVKQLNSAQHGAIRFSIGKQISTAQSHRLDQGHFWTRDHTKKLF